MLILRYVSTAYAPINKVGLCFQQRRKILPERWSEKWGTIPINKSVYRECTPKKQNLNIRKIIRASDARRIAFLIEMKKAIRRRAIMKDTQIIYRTSKKKLCKPRSGISALATISGAIGVL